MNKLDGLLLLKVYGLPTVNLLQYNEIIVKNTIGRGLSLRLSSKIKNSIDFGLPSIHNCYNLDDIKNFYNKYSSEYNVIIHETVEAKIIGSVSKHLLNGVSSIIIETYKNFEDRKKEIIDTREIFNNIEKIDPKKQYIDYNKIIKFINILPYDSLDIEFVIENRGIIFTDFYSIDSCSKDF